MKKFLLNALKESFVTFCEVLAGSITIGIPFLEITWFICIQVALTSAIVTFLYKMKGISEV